MSALSYKEFMEEAKLRLRKLSTEELCSLILNWASEEHPSRRQEFLDKIIHPEPKKEAQFDGETLMGEVEAFAQSVDEGAYCDGWGWDDAIHEERDWGDESWAQEMDGFLLQARSLLLQGEYETAEKVYRKLFETLEMGRDPGHLPGDPDSSSMLNIDLNEQIALFLRSVYMNATSDERPALLYEEMNDCGDKYGKIKFKTIMDALDTQLPDLDVFLTNWIEFLKNESLMHASELLREAVVLKGGIPSISEFARQNAERYPSAYLDWIAALEKENDINSVIQVAREGLSKVPRDYTVRAEIAEILSRIGEKLGDNKLKLEGYRECFYSSPSIKYLLDLYSISIECRCFEEIREEAECRMMELQGKSGIPETDDCSKEQNTSFVSESVLLNALLLGGRFEKVFEMCKDKETLGSVTTFMMAALSKEGTYSKWLYRQWEDAIRYTEHGMSEEYIEKYRKVAAHSIKQYMRLNQEQEDFCSKWCVDEIGRRVDEIVSNQHRWSYHKAAGLLVAMAEVLANRAEKQEGMDFIERYRKKYPKHNAFKSEVTKALQASGLFNGKVPERTRRHGR